LFRHPLFIELLEAYLHQKNGTSTMMDLPIWNAETLYEMVGDDVPMQSRMLNLFLREAEKQIPAIERAVAAGELALAADLAHVLKTSARMVGALSMGLLCEEIETTGDAQKAVSCFAKVQLLAAVFSSAKLKIQTQMAVPVQL
jgi:HPt (histidine-containing phosphotransfer) domain-containing protein